MKAISHILSILILFAGLLLITSCEKGITPPAYQSQLLSYHTESLTLQQVTADSVHRFQMEVESLAVKFDVKEKNKSWQYYRLEVTKKATNEPNFILQNFKLLY